MKNISIILMILSCFTLSGCAALNQVSKKIVDTVSYRNPVTGARDLGFMSEEEEIKAGEEAENNCIEAFRKQGIAVDEDPGLPKLRNMLARITEVSHRPNLPWVIHFVSDKKTVNAFALPGGKIFVFQGLIGNLVVNEDELAGVIAHEVSHVTCRHQVKGEAWNLIIPMIQKRARKEIYQACYTNAQEDQADRVGLLYMALAGYNPEVVYNIWARANARFGSNPGNYTYDHSLNIDRTNKVAQLIPIAKRYYVGEGIKNPNYSNILMNNDLIPRNNIQDENSLLAILSLGLNTYSQYMTTTVEEKNREYNREHTGTAQSKQNYLGFARTENTQQAGTIQDDKYGNISSKYFVYINADASLSKRAEINLTRVFGSYQKTKDYDKILLDEQKSNKFSATEMRKEQNDKMMEILKDIEKATAQFGNKNQYKAIYNSRMPNCNEEDVSDEIISILNNQYSVLSPTSTDFQEKKDNMLQKSQQDHLNSGEDERLRIWLSLMTIKAGMSEAQVEETLGTMIPQKIFFGSDSLSKANKNDYKTYQYKYGYQVQFKWDSNKEGYFVVNTKTIEQK